MPKFTNWPTKKGSYWRKQSCVAIDRPSVIETWHEIVNVSPNHDGSIWVYYPGHGEDDHLSEPDGSKWYGPLLPPWKVKDGK